MYSDCFETLLKIKYTAILFRMDLNLKNTLNRSTVN